MGRSDLRIPAIPCDVKETLRIAAKNKGETRAAFLRPKVREILDAYPDEMKQPKKNVEISELGISGVSDDVINQLTNIADHLGVSPTQLIRIKLIQLSKEIPEWMKSETD